MFDQFVKSYFGKYKLGTPVASTKNKQTIVNMSELKNKQSQYLLLKLPNSGL